MPGRAPDEFEHTLGENVVLAGQYEIVRKLGEGGMGEVHLAKDRLLNDRLVAIKMLPALRAASKRAMKQLRREAAAMADLTHEHIVRFFHFSEHKGLPFLVMQYIEGQTLDDLLGEKEALSADELIEIAKPIAKALDYAHSKGVVHKDIKPANIFIDKAGKAYLADFGIARVAKDTITQVTGRDLTSGTLHYMSPEQCRGELKLTPASDIYSFATMLYECLCGHVPFPTGPIRELILHQSPPPLEDQSPLAKAVMQALAKSPDDRPGTAGELLRQAAEKPSVATRAEDRNSAPANKHPLPAGYWRCDGCSHPNPENVQYCQQCGRNSAGSVMAEAFRGAPTPSGTGRSAIAGYTFFLAAALVSAVLNVIDEDFVGPVNGLGVVPIATGVMGFLIGRPLVAALGGIALQLANLYLYSMARGSFHRDAGPFLLLLVAGTGAIGAVSAFVKRRRTANGQRDGR